MHKLILPKGGFQNVRHLVNQQTDQTVQNWESPVFSCLLICPL